MALSTSTHASPNGAGMASQPQSGGKTQSLSATPQPVLSRLSRRRRAVVWGLGIALVCAGGALSAAVTMAAGNRVPVISVVRAVNAGEVISAADLGEARVAADPQLDPIPAAERSTVVGQRADVELRPGTLLTRSQLTTEVGPGRGQALVGVPLKPGQLPSRPLRHSDRVLVVQSADAEAASTGPAEASSSPAVRGAVVVATGPAGPEGTVVVDLLVREDDGVVLAGAAAAGRLSLVLLPRAR